MNPHIRPLLIILQTVLILLISGCQVSPSPTRAPTRAVLTPQITPTRNSTMPTATIAPTAVPCLESEGQILVEKIDTELLPWPLEFVVYLPPCYEQPSQQAYPVLYLLHGQGKKDDQWQRLGLLDAADELIAAGEITPLIIVMPYEVSWSAGPEKSKYGEALLADLFPYIEDTYNACTMRECRMIGGLSRGGNWAVNLGFAHPELFTAVGSHSAPLFYGEVNRILPIIENRTTAGLLPYFYVDVGNKDENLRQVLEFVALLKKYSIPYNYTQFNGYHTEDYWRAHVKDYLSWYSNQVSITP